MQKQFQLLLFLLSSIAVVNNIKSLDRDSVLEQQFNAAVERFNFMAIKIADRSMEPAARWIRTLRGVINIYEANGVNGAKMAAYKKLNKTMLLEGLKFRNNCRVLEVDKRAAERSLKKAELVVGVAEGIRLAAHREIAACNSLEHTRYTEAVGSAARIHNSSVIAQNAITNAHRELDQILLRKQKEISDFSRIIAVAALKSYKER